MPFGDGRKYGERTQKTKYARLIVALLEDNAVVASRSCFKMWFDVPLVFIAAVGAGTGVDATGPAIATCTSIEGSLSHEKIATKSLLNFKYAQYKVFWNTRLDRKNTACIVFPTLTNDVSTLLKTIKAASSRFAIKAGRHSPNKDVVSTKVCVLLDLGNMKDKSSDPSVGHISLAIDSVTCDCMCLRFRMQWFDAHASLCVRHQARLL